jgi:hypothetical protein
MSLVVSTITPQEKKRKNKKKKKTKYPNSLVPIYFSHQWLIIRTEGVANYGPGSRILVSYVDVGAHPVSDSDLSLQVE